MGQAKRNKEGFDQETKRTNTREVNKLIHTTMWYFMTLPSFVLFFSYIGLFSVEKRYAMGFFIVSLCTNLFLFLLSRTNINENYLRYITMIATEVIIMVLGMKATMGINITYILVPVISCAYLDRKFTIKVSIVSYFMMLIAVFVRASEAVQLDFPDYDALHWALSFSAAYTIEYVALFLAIMLLSSRTQSFLAKLTAHSQKIITLQQNTIGSFADLIESRDNSTGQHVKRTSGIVKIIVDGMQSKGIYKEIMNDELCERICQAAPLHDIGKIRIPDSILCKPGRLTDEEMEQIKTHTVAGAEIITKSLSSLEEMAFIQVAKDVALFHHERWDGAGYPTGTSGETIPVGARIMAVADVFDALISKRCYKETMEYDQAFDIIKESQGSHFDPVIVEVFLAEKAKIIDICEQAKCREIK
ncbi:MAG: HD domain-containing phosphohydrolase [bacterium]|nr:HD domain-containing phosphohydrolase [bacterium]